MADSSVYILTECYEWDGWEEILAVFSTLEAAEMAKQHYENRLNKQRGYWYEITKKEILDVRMDDEATRSTTGTP